MRPEKASIVSDLKEKLSQSPFIIVADYQKMNVNHFADLRTRLAANGAEVHVVKNSFLRRAISDSGLPDVAEQLTGQTAVVTGDKDAAPVAKILKTFAGEFKVAAVKIGIVDKAVLSTQQINQLADLPPRDVLLAQLLGLLMSPATKLVRLLNEPASALARLLNAKAAKMPAPPVAAEPTPPAEEKEEAAKVEAAKVEAAAPEVAPTAEAAKEETPKEEAPKEEPPKEEGPAPEAAG